MNDHASSARKGLRRGARYDSIFYGAFSGAGNTFDIRVRFDLKKPLQLDKFQAAANKALQCYPEFSVRPVIKDGRVFYEENLKQVKLAPDDGKTLCFGTDGEDGTNGYLFVFLYGERHVTFSLFHGITDARGMIAYVISVLWNYVCSVAPLVRIAGTKMFTKHGIRISPAPYFEMDETERNDPLTAFAGPGEPINLIDNDKLFRMPPEQYAQEDLSCRLLNLEISNKAFEKKTKELGTSFGPLLTAITAQAIARAYDIGDKTISVVLTADPRRQFGTFSFGNMAYNVPLPVTAADLEQPLEALCSRLRSDMKKQLTKENAAANYSFILGQCDEIDAMGDIVAVNKALTAPGGIETLTTNGTIFLTYPGRVASNPISRTLLDGVSPGMLAVERAVVVYAHRDSLIVQVTQKSDDMTLVNALKDVLADMGFAPAFHDMGRVAQNVLELDRLKKDGAQEK